MFYFIEGKLEVLEPTFAVLNCGGVGYKLTISETTREQMPPFRSVKEPPVVRLYTHLAVREDDVELFGFGSMDELNAFKKLISVSGVGPKAAMAVLSILTPEKFALAVCSEDTKAISKASGVGAKTAARIVLELKDKLLKESGGELPEGLSVIADRTETGHGRGKTGEALDALTVLGYSRAEAMNALSSVDGTLDLEEIIKAALKKLMRNF